MLEMKIIIHDKREYYIIDKVEFGHNSICDYELYESTTYGDDVPQLIINDTTKEAIGWTCNGFDELFDNEYAPTINKDYTIK